MGHRSKRSKLFAETHSDALVSADNLYRQLESRLDLSFGPDLVPDCYDEIGRPSIHPVLLFKLHLIGFFERITSERQLMETLHLNPAHRWYSRAATRPRRPREDPQPLWAGGPLPSQDPAAVAAAAWGIVVERSVVAVLLVAPGKGKGRRGIGAPMSRKSGVSLTPISAYPCFTARGAASPR